jgi:pimeloyl-ACP methyl ester carboxylesterase
VSPYAPTLPSWTATGADGVEIAVYEFGGAGEPLLLAHATGFCATMYRPLGSELIDRFRVLAIDFRGHGRSGRPANDDFGWDRMAEDVLSVVERIGSTPIAGFGHSMGGAALLMAEERRPGTFASLFLFEPIVFPDDSTRTAPSFMAELARARRSTFPSRDDALARYASRPPLNTMRADVLKAYVDDGFVDLADGSVRLACDPEDEARTFESESKVHTASVEDVTSAVTVSVGHDEEGPNPARLGPGLVAALPHAELVTRHELGHLGPFQDPVLVAEDIRIHAQRVDGQRGR